MWESKFKAWDEEVKHMYQPGNHHVILQSNGACINLQTGVKLIPLFFTGSNDKNGREIYSGDVIRFNGGMCQPVAKVVFKNNSFCADEWEHLDLHKFTDVWEVIGNIYENPELLTR